MIDKQTTEAVPRTSAAKPRLLFYCPQYGRGNSQGGVGVSAERITLGLSREFDVQVITCNQELSPMQWVEQGQGSVRILNIGVDPDRLRFRKHLFDRVNHELHRQPYDGVCIFYVNGDSYSVALAAKARGVPYYSMLRGNDIHQELFSSDHALIASVMDGAAKNICVASDMLPVVGTFSKRNAIFVPNGIDLAGFPFIRKSGDSLKSPPTIGLFGDIKSKKGLDLILSDIDLESMRLQIVGEVREDVRKLLHGFLTLNPQFSNRIELIPKRHSREAVIESYKTCDLVCVPSRHEGMPNVLLEAMALGIPCLASATGGALDLIENCVNGFLFDLNEVNGLSRSLQRFLELDVDQCDALCRNARKTIETRFTAVQETDRLSQLVRKKVRQPVHLSRNDFSPEVR